MTDPARALVAEEIHIVDAARQPRLVLSAQGGTPQVTLLGPDGATAMLLSLDADGHPSVRLSNPVAQGATARLEVDAKGAHVRFDGQGGAAAYLFLSNAGAQGVVLGDASGVRRFSAVVMPDGAVQVQQDGAASQPST